MSDHTPDHPKSGALASLRSALNRRPLWMNGLLAFCAYMTFIYLPWDVFIKPLEVDQEVWFGILFTGWAAKAGALLHWFVYGAGTLGLWHMRAWLQPWLSLYLLQIAYGMAYWSLTDPRGSGLPVALIVPLVFVALAGFAWRERHRLS